MKIVLIHQAFALPSQPGGTRHYELSRYLVSQKHDISVVTSSLNYLTGKAVSEHRGLVIEHHVDGISVLYAYMPPTLHKNFAWRIVAFLGFMFTSIIAALRVKNVDIVMGTTPSIFQAFSAWLVAFLRRRPFLLEVRDLWPEFAVDMGVLKSPILIALSRWLESFLYARATHIVVNSPAYRDYLLNKYIPDDKISVIPNGVDTKMFQPENKGEDIRKEFKLEEKFVAVYAGALGAANDITSIVRAAKHLGNHNNIHFLIVGDGKERNNLEGLADKLMLANITFAGSRPKHEMPQFIAAANVCLATLQNIPMFRTTYPNKVFDYMAAGRPTILGIDGAIRDVIEQAEGGVFVPPGDHEKLAEAIHALSIDKARCTQLGHNAREYVVKHFDRQIHAKQFVELLTRLSPTADEFS